jgi:hypothetical protein
MLLTLVSTFRAMLREIVAAESEAMGRSMSASAKRWMRGVERSASFTCPSKGAM